MATPINQETREKFAQEARNETLQKIEESGLSFQKLLSKLKKELNWKETKTMKIKGAVDPESLPKGFKIVATTGIIEHRAGEDGGQDFFSDGETVIQWNEKSGGMRQRARMDAHKLRGDYPSKKIDHNLKGEVVVNIIKFTDSDFGNDKSSK